MVRMLLLTRNIFILTLTMMMPIKRSVAATTTTTLSRRTFSITKTTTTTTTTTRSVTAAALCFLNNDIRTARNAYSRKVESGSIRNPMPQQSPSTTRIMMMQPHRLHHHHRHHHHHRDRSFSSRKHVHGRGKNNSDNDFDYYDDQVKKREREEGQLLDDDDDADDDTRNDHNQREHNHLEEFQPGHAILVEVISFGPLGASVHVVAPSHDPQDLPSSSVTMDGSDQDDWPVLGVGLISQRELSYYRDSRNGVDVVVGEILPAYVERIRSIDNRLGIGLRPFGGKQKTQTFVQELLQVLEGSGGGGDDDDDDDGALQLGDKSSPEEIATMFPGVSKSTFKKAVSALYKQGKIDKPQPHQIQLLKK